MITFLIYKISFQKYEKQIEINNAYSLNLNQSNFHRLNQWFALLLIHQWKNIFHCLISWLFITDWNSGKNVLTVKSVNFHWSDQWNLTDSQ